ncbi:prolipoprotein diacylglyceryl transferase family protein [Phenylobacterium sp.]|uniref:prolipoprotein diacylglyceryl transferase family protein n=1 Tax=Phenylobacterium sp. TaxID=1871053 RepID=UPI0038620C5B
MIVAGAAISRLFGRLENFINGELRGRVTDLRLGNVICTRRLMADNKGVCPARLLPRQPSQLYEAILEGMLLFLLARLVSPRSGWLSRRGAVAGLFLVVYGSFRILLETARNPDLAIRSLPHGLTTGIVLSGSLLAFGLALRRQVFRPEQR